MYRRFRYESMASVARFRRDSTMRYAVLVQLPRACGASGGRRGSGNTSGWVFRRPHRGPLADVDVSVWPRNPRCVAGNGGSASGSPWAAEDPHGIIGRDRLDALAFTGPEDRAALVAKGAAGVGTVADRLELPRHDGEFVHEAIAFPLFLRGHSAPPPDYPSHSFSPYESPYEPTPMTRMAPSAKPAPTQKLSPRRIAQTPRAMQ